MEPYPFYGSHLFSIVLYAAIANKFDYKVFFLYCNSGLRRMENIGGAVNGVTA